MPDDEQTIRDLIAEWHRASAAGDLFRVLELMADDVVFLGCGRPPMRGKEAFAADFRGVGQQFRMDGTNDIQEIRISGDTAYCWNHVSVTLTPIEGGAPLRRSGHTLTIFRKQADGRWV